MKVSLLKISRKKEVVKRIELSELAGMIKKNPNERTFCVLANLRHVPSFHAAV